MTEADILRSILALGTDSVRLWRFQVGEYWTSSQNNIHVKRERDGSLTVTIRNARRVTIGAPGMSDTIGLRSIVVTPDMIGQRVAIFTAIEVKSARGRATQQQQNFIDVIKELGGRAGIAKSVPEALIILSGK